MMWRRMLLSCLVIAATLLRPIVVARSNTVTLSLPDWAIAVNARNQPPPPRQIRRNVEETLLGWAQRMREHHANETTSRLPPQDPFLVIGAKSSVVHGFTRRQTIRQTWASASFLPPNVRLVFLGCESNLSLYSSTKQQELQQAIALERKVFGDLLTSELLECEDSFARLADKVRAFFHWAATSHPSLVYAMVIDDDIYLRLDRVVSLLEQGTTPRSRFFGGNSASSEYRGLAEPIRDPRNKYFIAKAAYPIRELPPFLTGAHYIVSGDLVRFVSKNFQAFQGLGAVDDATVGLWLFATLGVRPVFIDDLHVLRVTKKCADDFVSLADLTTVATYHIHENLLQRRGACHDFEFVHWMKTMRGIIASPTRVDDSNFLTLFWDFQYAEKEHRVQFLIRLALRDQLIEFAYTPSSSRVSVGFCGRASALLQEKLYLAVDDGVCGHHCEILLSAVNEAVNESPALHGILALPRHNLKQQTIEESLARRTREVSYGHGDAPTFTVILARSAQLFRVMIECLFVSIIHDKQVLVVYEDEVSSTSPSEVYVVSQMNSTAEIKRAIQRHTAAGIVLGTVDLSLGDFPLVVLSASGTLTQGEITISTLSLLFVNSIRFTPRQLLLSRREHGIPAQAAEVVVIGCIDVGDLRNHEIVIFLQESFGVDVIDVCKESLLLDDLIVDKSVQQLSAYRFALILGDTSASRFLSVDIQIAIAFLARTIPIYSGKLKRLSTIFNQAAFIQCDEILAAEACLDRVTKVQGNPDDYGKMFEVAPIEDFGAFRELFAWHPDTNEGKSPDSIARICSQLKSLLGI